jgi:hypothetical protein
VELEAEAFWQLRITDKSLEGRKMCLNCGCGEYQKRHKPTDITMHDLAIAAVGQGMQIREVASNLQDALRAIGRADKAREEKSPV